MAPTYPLIARNRVVAALAATAFVSAGALFGGSVPGAQASAFGCSGYGPTFIYHGAKFPKGTYCVQISGTGTYVNYVYGQAQVNNAVFGTTCNWNITAEFFNTRGQWYKTINGPVRNSCFSAAGASYTIPVRARMQPGLMCSTLKSNGARQTSVCHSIKP